MATEIINGKLMEIRYIRPDAAGGGSGLTNSAEDAWNLAESVTNHAAGMELRFINSGTFTDTSISRVYSNDGTGDAPIIFTGRNSTDTAYESSYIVKGAYQMDFSSKNCIVKYLDITSNHTTCSCQVADNKSIIYNCKLLNTSTSTTQQCNGLLLVGGVGFNNYIESQNVSLSSSYTGAFGCQRSIAFGNKIVSKYRGVRFGASGSFFNNLIIGNGIGSGVYVDDYYNVQMIKNNTIYNFQYGIDLYAEDAADNSTFIINNLFHTCSSDSPSVPGYAINLRITTGQYDFLINAMGNRYYNCDYFMLQDKYNLNNLELTADPFINAGVDYELNDISNGGMRCKNISSPAYTWTWDH